MLNTSTSQDRKLSNLVKIYINNAKYINSNNSFTLKLIIFHYIYSRADILSEAKIKTFLIMLKSPALDNCFSNIGFSGAVMNSNQVHYSIKKK